MDLLVSNKKLEDIKDFVFREEKLHRCNTLKEALRYVEVCAVERLYLDTSLEDEEGQDGVIVKEVLRVLHRMKCDGYPEIEELFIIY